MLRASGQRHCSSKCMGSPAATAAAAERDQMHSSMVSHALQHTGLPHSCTAARFCYMLGLEHASSSTPTPYIPDPRPWTSSLGWGGALYLGAVRQAFCGGTRPGMVVHISWRSALAQQPGLQHVHQLCGSHLHDPPYVSLTDASLGPPVGEPECIDSQLADGITTSKTFPES